MYEAIVYRICGPRSHVEAIKKFNELDHKDKIFNTNSGLSSYIKSVLGKDFAFRAMNERYGFSPDRQILETSNTGIKIHIPITKRGVGMHFNAVLIVDKDAETHLTKPVYFIALDEELVADKPTYVNIDVGYNKLNKEK